MNFCSNCGQKVEESNFCSNCGKEIKQDEQSSSSAIPAPVQTSTYYPPHIRAIAQMLRDARKNAGLTQQQLSDKYEIPLRTLQSWEGVKRVPPTYVVNLLLRCIEADFSNKQGEV